MSINTCRDCVHFDDTTAFDLCSVDDKIVLTCPGRGICSFFDPLPTFKPMVDFAFLRGRKHNRIRMEQDDT